MRNLAHDVRYAARKLRRTPGFTVVTVLTLAIAIGATTSMFSVVNSVILKPLPFADPDRLMFVESTAPNGTSMPVSPQDLVDYRNGSKSFSAIAAVVGGESANLARAAESAARLNEARVGANFFAVLGVRPTLGRFFAPGEDSAAAARVVVVSHAAWTRYFGADTGLIGRSIGLDGKSYRVVGIAAPSLTYPQSPDIWIPAVWKDYEIGDKARGFHSITALGRLAPGATETIARRELQTVAARLAMEFPGHNAKVGAYVNQLQAELVGEVGRALWTMFGAVAFVLIIACTNVANLLLVRAASRESEIAVRSALGAGRRAIVRQLIVESLLLAVGGALLGIIVASWALNALVVFGPRSLPRIDEIAIDGRVLAFTMVLALVTGLVFGIVPALHSARSDISQLLRGARGSGGSRTNRTRSALVLCETAFSMVLLVGAGLLIRSFERLTRVDPGFRPNRLVVFDVALSGDDRYDYDRERIGFAYGVRSRLLAQPWVQSVGITADRPFDPEPQFRAGASFTIDGDPKPQAGAEPTAHILPVTPGYFATTGMSLARGRVFSDAENRIDVPPVLLVNEALAKQYFAGQNPIGRRITFGFSHTTTPNDADSIRMRGEIVGVVRDVTNSSLGEKAGPAAYVPYATAPFAATFVMRTSGDPSLAEGAVYRIVRDVDKTAAVYEVGTMDAAMSASVARPRFYALLLGAFAGIALLLATLGIFGVVSYAVEQRTREFGIRIALGATSRQVSRAVLRGGVTLAALGVGTGAIAAAGMTTAIRGLLFGTDPLDVPTYVTVAIVLIVVAAIAAWLPARQAAQVDPVIAMRAE